MGVSLAQHLAEKDANITILSRSQPLMTGPWQHVSWNAKSLGAWTTSLDGADALINLCGRSVNCVKTPDHQDEILRSRLVSTTLLGDAMRRIKRPPPVWIQMSTAHIYGDPPYDICTEQSPLGYGFAPSIGRAWEEAFACSKLPSQRLIEERFEFEFPNVEAALHALVK